MKTFIFTYDRYDSLSTPSFFEKENIEHTILCHTEEAKNKFIEAGRVNPERIISTNQPKGLANNRNYALDQMEEGEWALFLVDDLNNLYEYENYDTDEREKLPIEISNVKEYRKSFQKVITASKFLERCEETIKVAEKENIKLIGFAGFTNPLFLKNKWKYNSLADGRAWLIKKSDLRFDEHVQLVDDVCWTVINIKSGGVIINQWLIPDCKRYTKGSFGSKSQRMPQKIEECKYMEEAYRDYVYFADKPGWPPFSHLRIKNPGRKSGSIGTYASPRITGEFLDCSMPMSFDQYSNCGYNCLYCFSTFQRAVGASAKNYLAKNYKKVSITRFKKYFEDLDNPKNPFRNIIKNRITMQWGGLSDPMCPIEEEEGLGYEILSYLKEIRYPICFSSKSDLLLRDEKYLKLFEGMGDIWSYKASIITYDAEKASLMEAGTPSPSRRLEVLEKLSSMGIWTIIRLRPFIIGLTDLTYEQLLLDAAKAGVKAISTEFFCLELRSMKVAKNKYDLISKIVGFDIVQYYKNISSTQGYLRLNRTIKEPYYKRMREICNETGMKLHISDAHGKEYGDSGSCCGLPCDAKLNPTLSNYSQFQFTNALMIAKKNGKVKFSDIAEKDVWAKGLEVSKGPGYNTGSDYKRNRKCSVDFYTYMRNEWNTPNAQNSPYKYFSGVLKPKELDENGDIVYYYDPISKPCTSCGSCTFCKG